LSICGIPPNFKGIMDIKKIYSKWIKFLEKRKANPYNFDNGDPDFITMRQRDRLITCLFAEIERLKNA
jgi:hypothetical protein